MHVSVSMYPTLKSIFRKNVFRSTDHHITPPGDFKSSRGDQSQGRLPVKSKEWNWFCFNNGSFIWISRNLVIRVVSLSPSEFGLSPCYINHVYLISPLGQDPVAQLAWEARLARIGVFAQSTRRNLHTHLKAFLLFTIYILVWIHFLFPRTFLLCAYNFSPRILSLLPR